MIRGEALTAEERLHVVGLEVDVVGRDLDGHGALLVEDDLLHGPDPLDALGLIEADALRARVGPVGVHHEAIAVGGPPLAAVLVGCAAEPAWPASR